MKLRTTGNSIRLRLSQSDVRQFVESSVVEEVVQIGPGREAALIYRLVRDDTSDCTKAAFAGNCLTISVASATADAWSASDEVGIEASQLNGDGAELSILIEKDFACLTPRGGDDDKDAFPNPGAACA